MSTPSDTANPPAQEQGLHLMAKPIGPLCNLDCDYCFYLEKEQMYPPREKFRMTDEVLRAYVQRYIAAQSTPEVEFTWQGGEPTLLGLDFFRRALDLQREYGQGKTIRNSLQTNGTLLEEEWCAFLAHHQFTVGLSLDGPQALHDMHRPDKQGRSSHAQVMHALRLLQQHGVQYNVLVTVTRDSTAHGLAIYRFLKGEGVRHIQFNPVVERMPAPREQVIGLHFATPPKLAARAPAPATAPTPAPAGEVAVTAQTVARGAYGDFLIAIFDEWVRNDVGTVHVMNFEWALAAWLQLPATVCLFAPRCGKAMIVEHSGDVFSCDHFMYPDYLLGNIAQDDPRTLAASAQQQAFGAAKEEALPDYCRRCPYLFACHGECPKNRFMVSPDGQPGMNYLCPSYEKYFRHITRAMNALGQIVASGMPASAIMEAYKGPLILKTTAVTK
ncbi:anaerobic sulfatase maturase [Duganella sp. LX20W]|uniref:Anaerobic sulfatase maturase n=1 Tax=Rugamonas brunnea TaxID=2758569 RepID=A0A7W2IBF0_9BURK|nr:anaerobic sulfatase maturase [Rugamonas brunnea]MBA5636882.1 anaerobic sulfatase maturase [Rugamonas brunnea]